MEGKCGRNKEKKEKKKHKYIEKERKEKKISFTFNKLILYIFHTRFAYFHFYIKFKNMKTYDKF